MHSVSTHNVSTLPSTATTAPLARLSACAAASSESSQDRTGGAAVDQAAVGPVGPVAESLLLARHHTVAEHHGHGAAARAQHEGGALATGLAHGVAEGLVDRAALGDLFVERSVRLDGLDGRAGRAGRPGPEPGSCSFSEARSSSRSIAIGRRPKPARSG